MAVITITSTPSLFPSIVTTAFGDHAFDADTPGADTLIVDPEAFLIATGDEAAGALLANTGAWTVTVNGSIHSEQSFGIALAAGNAAPSTITLGEDGQVSGNVGIAIGAGSTATITNFGVIRGDTAGILTVDGTNTIVNSGLLAGINPILDLFGHSSDIVTNSGTILGQINLSGGNDRLTNSGLIDSKVFLGDGNNILVNSGTITNSVEGGAGNDRFSNSNFIEDDVTLGDGLNRFTNTGTVYYGRVFGGHDTDVIANSGTIGGDVFLSAGNDVFKNTGRVQGEIYLGGGDDKFTGGGFADSVRDHGGGSDTVALGGGNDHYFAARGIGFSPVDGTDIINAGAGIDTYDATGAFNSSTNKPIINLDGVAHDLSILFPGAPGVGAAAANTATGDAIAGDFKDTITGFENVTGGSSDDIIYGSDVANALDGAFGADYLFGFAGNDTLSGDVGNDHLAGGAGRDILTGGGHDDMFWFLATTDSGVTKATRDLIQDFEDGATGGDVINLSRIDANATTAGDDAFDFIGTNAMFSGSAGELRAYWTATGQIVEGDINGDGRADFAIELADAAHAIILNDGANTDFIL